MIKIIMKMIMMKTITIIMYMMMGMAMIYLTLAHFSPPQGTPIIDLKKAKLKKRLFFNRQLLQKLENHLLYETASSQGGVLSHF